MTATACTASATVIGSYRAIVTATATATATDEGDIRWKLRQLGW